MSDWDDGVDPGLGRRSAARRDAVEIVVETLAGDVSEVSIVEVSSSTFAVSSVAQRDWPAALRRVERAAGIIQDYEQKFVAIEQDARSFVQRVSDEQSRLSREIAALEQQLAAARSRAGEAEAALEAAELVIQGLRIENGNHLQRLADVERELRTSNSYMRKVEDLLGGI